MYVELIPVETSESNIAYHVRFSNEHGVVGSVPISHRQLEVILEEYCYKEGYFFNEGQSPICHEISAAGQLLSSYRERDES
jgi:hypothetical protein